MKYCSQCGHANEDDALFCVKDGCKLGEPIDGSQKDKPNMQICTKCGFENESNIKFCGGCGKPLSVNEQTKRARRGSFSTFIIALALLFAIIVGFGVYKYIHGGDVSELLDDVVELFEKEYHSNVRMHHSTEVDMDGETINFSLDTDAEWFDVRNLEISVYDVRWCTIDGKDLMYEKFIGRSNSYDCNENFCLKPIINIEFVDNRNFRIIVDENRGYNREIIIKIDGVDKEKNFHLFNLERLDQRGYRGFIERR